MASKKLEVQKFAPADDSIRQLLAGEVRMRCGPSTQLLVSEPLLAAVLVVHRNLLLSCVLARDSELARNVELHLRWVRARLHQVVLLDM